MKTKKTKKETSVSGKTMASECQNEAHRQTRYDRKNHVGSQDCISTASPISPSLSEEKSFRLRNAHLNAVRQLEKCHEALTDLAALRLHCKLSNMRVVGVARELNELRKVMAVYSQTVPTL